VPVASRLEELLLIDEAFCRGELSWTRLQLEGRVARGEKGRPPRDDARALPRVMMTHTARLGVLAAAARRGAVAQPMAPSLPASPRRVPI